MINTYEEAKTGIRSEHDPELLHTYFVELTDGLEYSNYAKYTSDDEIDLYDTMNLEQGDESYDDIEFPEIPF